MGNEQTGPGEGQGELPDQDAGLDGAQYNEDFQAEDLYLDEYDGYAMPSEGDEPEYIWVMQEADSDTSPALLQMEDTDWEVHRNTICKRYQNAPWCEVCAKYKDHCLIAEAFAEDKKSLAWKNCDKFERDLIHLGWTMALEASPACSEQAMKAALGSYIAALEWCNQELMLRDEVSHQNNDCLIKQNKDLQKFAEAASGQIEELQQELKGEQLNSSLRGERPTTG
ncbi:hypothetical protein BC827DRAFT_1265612 [Russula dissimulans]|nr:hypothetical protein BC827DRAFT_1265612 [Russula dissimulans]